MQSRHGFSFDITLRHPSEMPCAITKALGLEPNFAWAAGSKAGSRIYSNTAWNATIASSAEMAPDAVFNRVLEFFGRVQEFCKSFVKTGGEINLILKGQVNAGPITDSCAEKDSRSKVFELSLYPEFLSLLRTLDLTLSFEMWA